MSSNIIMMQHVYSRKLSGSVQAGPIICDYVVAIFQVAQNQLKFGMSTLFVLKNITGFFFKNAEKYGQKWVKFSVRLQTT